MTSRKKTHKEENDSLPENASPVCYINASELRPEYKKEEVYQITIIDEFEQEKTISYTPRSYRNLMELVVNELWEEWGDCKGRAMCGTCHVEVIDGDIGEVDSFEQHTLDGLSNKTPRSRLACQMMVDRSIHNMTFKILRDSV